MESSCPSHSRRGKRKANMGGALEVHLQVAALGKTRDAPSAANSETEQGAVQWESFGGQWSIKNSETSLG